jgi:hypothetical protein
MTDAAPLRFATAAVWTSCAVALRSSFSGHGLPQVRRWELEKVEDFVMAM